jgi:peptidyl-dipeptidase Dcp
MGHAVHGLFSDVTYPSLAGTSVPRDFVEFPSTFEEDWAILPRGASELCHSLRNREAIPQELIDVIAARSSTRDLIPTSTWGHHGGYGVAPASGRISHTKRCHCFEQESLAKYSLNNPAIPPRYKSPYFSHIFSGGYSANYYAYIWSEILAADAFAFMEEKGGLTLENGDRYRRRYPLPGRQPRTRWISIAPIAAVNLMCSTCWSAEG